MMTFKSINSKYIALVIVMLFLVTSCKKDSVEYTKEQEWSKEVYDAMKDIYLWNDALPSSFDAQRYASAENALSYLTSLKIDPTTNQPIDRYSFLDKIGKLSGEIGGGQASGDYGFMVLAGKNANNGISFYVNYVYKQSSAAKAGVERAMEVVKINGSIDVHPLALTNNRLDVNSSGYINMVKALFNSSSATFTFKRSDGSLLDAPLVTSSYSINSVLIDSVYEINGKRIGYLVFNQFLAEPSQKEIKKSIDRFESRGVQYLVVDLRYNGGGSVATCAYFSNLILPRSATGKVMFTAKYNSVLTQYYRSKGYSFSELISKTNGFEPLKVYFIVGSGTASASELLINNLRPYYSGNIFLIGDVTYGKPCGFWAVPIGYKEDQTTPKEGYDLYAVSEETVNADNDGGYYTGMTPGSSKYPGVMEQDSYTLPWGDINDRCLAQAISHITNNSFKSAAAKSATAPAIKGSIDRQFKGMIFTAKDRKNRW